MTETLPAETKVDREDGTERRKAVGLQEFHRMEYNYYPALNMHYPLKKGKKDLEGNSETLRMPQCSQFLWARILLLSA